MSESSQRPTSRGGLPSPRPGDQRKSEIIQSAIDIIAKDGIDSLTFESVGKKLGIRKSHVAYHFSDKREIIYRAIQFIALTGQEMTAENLKRVKEPEKQILMIVESAFDWAHAYPNHLNVMLFLYYQASHKQEYRLLLSKIRESGAQRMSDILLKYKNPRQLAKLIQALITGQILESFSTQAPPIGEARRAVVQGVKRLLNGWPRRLVSRSKS